MVWSLCCDWWSFGVGSTCGYGLVGRDKRAKPKVRPMGSDEGEIFSILQVLMCSHGTLPWLRCSTPESLSAISVQWAPTWWSSTGARTSWAVGEGGRGHAP